MPDSPTQVVASQDTEGHSFCSVALVSEEVKRTQKRIHLGIAELHGHPDLPDLGLPGTGRAGASAAARLCQLHIARILPHRAFLSNPSRVPSC